jgi:uncharacterized protein (DUF302 family)
VNAIGCRVGLPLPEAETAVRAALAREGFGVLTEIDVAATLEAKLGVHRPPLKILGACNPSFAHRALELDPSLALVLPCNVVLEEAGADRTLVSIADPRSMMDSDGDAGSALADLGEEAATVLQRVADRLAG